MDSAFATSSNFAPPLIFLMIAYGLVLVRDQDVPGVIFGLVHRRDVGVVFGMQFRVGRFLALQDFLRLGVGQDVHPDDVDVGGNLRVLVQNRP